LNDNPVAASTVMSTQNFATIGIRLLGIAAILIGIVFAGGSGVMHLLGVSSAANVSTANLHLHDTYYVVSHGVDTWLGPGAISLIAGVLLLVISRRLGAFLARGTDVQS
jgi:hypothetical protein